MGHTKHKYVKHINKTHKQTVKKLNSTKHTKKNKGGTWSFGPAQETVKKKAVPQQKRKKQQYKQKERFELGQAREENAGRSQTQYEQAQETREEENISRIERERREKVKQKKCANAKGKSALSFGQAENALETTTDPAANAEWNRQECERQDELLEWEQDSESKAASDQRAYNAEQARWKQQEHFGAEQSHMKENVQPEWQQTYVPEKPTLMEGNNGQGNGDENIYRFDPDHDLTGLYQNVENYDDDYNPETELIEGEDSETVMNYVEILIESQNGEEPPNRGDCHSSLTIDNQLDLIDRELSIMTRNYYLLLESVSNETVAEYNKTGEFKEVTHAWYLDVKHRGRQGFQRYNRQDVTNAFMYFIPYAKRDDKYRILSLREGDDGNRNAAEDQFTTISKVVSEYLFKIATALFTKANVSYAVLHYPIPQRSVKYDYLRNLMCLLSDALGLINREISNIWDDIVQVEKGNSQYVHSGGNLFLLLAGTLCYLRETDGDYQGGLLEEIRREFDNYLDLNRGAFYRQLKGWFQDQDFCGHIKDMTSQMSDLDFLFVTDIDEYVTEIRSDYGPKNARGKHDPTYPRTQFNRTTKHISDASAYSLRRILCLAHDYDEADKNQDPDVIAAHNIMPFANGYGPEWPNFYKTDFTGTSERVVDLMNEMSEGYDFRGYSQGSNFISDIPIYLLRVKQGYRDYPSVMGDTPDLKHMEEGQNWQLASKYGECLDLVIGDRKNDLYLHKQENFKRGGYYEIETLAGELEVILQGAVDDKTAKRQGRLAFCHMIDCPEMNFLYKIIASHIGEDDVFGNADPNNNERL